MPVAARWGDRQHTADRLDPKLPLMLFNEGNHLPNRRSGSACAKYADAFLRIPLAWRSCLFPRSNAFSRARRSLVKPSRRRAHRRPGPLERTGRVACRVKRPSFDAIALWAALSLSYSGRCWRKRRPPHSRKSAVYFGGFLLVHRAHPLRVLHPINPGRFILSGRVPKKLYDSIDALQTDLDEWLHHHNHQPTHQGKMCCGRTPFQTMIEGKKICKEKFVN